MIVAIGGEYGSGSDAAGQLGNSGRSPILLSLCVASMQWAAAASIAVHPAAATGPRTRLIYSGQPPLLKAAEEKVCLHDD